MADIQTAFQITTAGNQAISTADGKQQLRADYAADADEAEIDNMIKAATLQVEAYTSRKCMPTVMEFYLTDFPNGGIVLPFSPVSAVTSIKYYDGDNAEQTWGTGNYYYSLYEEPCRIRYVASAPGVYPYRFNAVTVTFTCGYLTADAIPKSLRQAILVKMADFYETRSDAPRAKFSNWEQVCYPDRVVHFLNENK